MYSCTYKLAFMFQDSKPLLKSGDSLFQYHLIGWTFSVFDVVWKITGN